MLRAHRHYLTRLLLALWLAASSVGVLHAAEHALDAEQHQCVACVASQTGAGPVDLAPLVLPTAPTPAATAYVTRAAHGQAVPTPAPRGPPISF